MKFKTYIFIVLFLALGYLAYGWRGVFWMFCFSVIPLLWLGSLTAYLVKNKLDKYKEKYPEKWNDFLKEISKD